MWMNSWWLIRFISLCVTYRTSRSVHVHEITWFWTACRFIYRQEVLGWSHCSGSFWRRRSSGTNLFPRWKASDNWSRFRDEAEQMHLKHSGGRQNETESKTHQSTEKTSADQKQRAQSRDVAITAHVSVILHLTCTWWKRLQPCTL